MIEDKDEALAAIRAAASQIVERFGLDSIQIFATMPPNRDGTRSFCFGLGNWFIRYGLVKSWTLRHEGQESETGAGWAKEGYSTEGF